MRFIMLVSLLVLLCCSCLQAQELSFTDDFDDYESGSFGLPNWELEGLLWNIDNGKLNVTGPMAVGYLAKQPRYKELNIEATVIIHKRQVDGWSVAGISVYADAQNLWHFALIESPESNGHKHHVELSELRDGNWLAHNNLTTLVNENGSFDWQYEIPYKLQIRLTAESIWGEVSDMSGQRLVQIGLAFDAPAVTTGRPGVRASGFFASYDDFKATGNHAVEGSEQVETPVYPPYDAPGSDLFEATATGYFRTEYRDNRWWCIDPNGKPFFAIGTDHCRFTGHGCESLGYAPYQKKNQEKWDSADAWGDQTVERLKSWGFNLIGAGGGVEVRYKGLAWTEFVAFGTAFSDIDSLVTKVNWTGFPNVFSPLWPQYCELRARQACTQLKNDPWLFGYFLDNELEWFGKSGSETGIFDDTMKRPADHTGKIALVDFLKGRHADISAFNAAWGTELKSWTEILSLDVLDGQNSEAVKLDKIDFVRLCAEMYYKYTTEAIRKYDPNHMVIGNRIAMFAPAKIWDICGKYCDIVTFNSYDRIDLEKGIVEGAPERFVEYYEMAQKPMMVTEWSFPALDSGLPCTAGAGMRVDTQTQRAECFRLYQQMLLTMPFMVGSDFFMWVDEPALGIAKTFPEDSNYGLVSEDDVPYVELTQMATRIHAQAYELHAGLVPEVGVREDGTVYNEGGSELTAQINAYIDGKLTVHTLTLAPDAEQKLKIEMPTTPGAHVLAFEVDLEHTSGDMNPANNAAMKQLFIPGVTLPEALKDMPHSLLSMCNFSNLDIDNPVATVELQDLPQALQELGQQGQLQVFDLGGNTVEAALLGDMILILPPAMKPWDCRTLIVTAAGQQAGTQVSSAGSFDLNLSPLSFVKAQDSGNIFDKVSYEGTELGSYNPLVHIEVGGQNQWVPASSTLQTQSFTGDLGTYLDITCAGGGGPAITAVDNQGESEAQKATAPSFEVNHKVLAVAGKPWFLARMGYIRNTSQRPIMIKGYFFYLHGNIGGDRQGDRQAGPTTNNVPNYYGTSGGAWQDSEVGLVYGALPLDNRLQAHFWQDEGGMQHPDARCQMIEPVTLEPGEVFEGPTDQWLLVYGAKVGDTTFTRKTADNLLAVKTQVVQ